ncbi:hypothetical protein AWB76_05176 [Caballeronia temeraria]|uniref:DUF2169 domain-containing protein n=1 Tax=Caballeronia temeraria TaxID=1777137 RepID=A0A158C6H6_9BURK|nr:DUF2169 domain-containing protein [Caballeronia temeraria]SAK77923.1 hypothetical protein AWB76_05176 [Caballeronia temeraria]
MDEPAFHNHSDLLADVLPIIDRDGAEARIVIVKASYDIRPGEALMPSETPRAVRMGDVMWGPAHIPDIRLPADYGLAKRGTDVVLAGHAMPPSMRAQPGVDVALSVAGRVKRLRVWGARLWQRAPHGVVPGASLALTATPLAWSRAYGGLDLSDPQRPLEEARNPVGSGIARVPAALIGTLAPQIEAPDAPIGIAGGRYVPAGCAPIGRSYAPRRLTMGTCDAAWLKHVYPARPADYRAEHENCASPDLIFDPPLQGGERVTAAGVHASAELGFRLPRWRIAVDALIDGALVQRRPALDTVVVDSDALILELVWRAIFRCPPKTRDRFTAIRVQAKEYRV